MIPQLPKRLASFASLAALTLSLGVGFATPAISAEQVVYPLPFGQPVVRFSGEMAQASYQVYLSPTALSQPLSFQLAPTSAISVMPEASWMHVSINGNPIGPVRLGTDRATTLQQRAISPHMLQAGWNTVSLSVDQRHRVDCSYPATFELWSDLQAASTGFVVETAPRVASAQAALSELAGMTLNNDGRLALHAVLPDNADEDTAQTLADALASLALTMQVEAPLVSVSHTSKADAINVQLDPAGNVAAGTFAVAAQNSGFAITLGGVTHTHWQAATMQLTDAMATYAPTQNPAGRHVLVGNDRFTLADLNLPSQEFSGRHFEQRFTLELPSDFFASDVGRAEIRLAGGYRDGLAEQAELSVQVNGALAASIPLDARRGEVFSDRSVYIDLGHFRAGQNDIAIMADVTHQSDADCDVATLTNAEPRFLLLDETSFSFPKFARLGQLPRLAPGLGHELMGSNAQTHIHIPHPDIQSISAAIALRVQLALDLHSAEGVLLSFEAPDAHRGDGGSSNDILIAALGDLPNQVAQELNLPMQEMTLAWTSPGEFLVFPDATAADPIMTASTATRTVLPSNQPLPPSVAAAPAQPAPWSNNPVEQRLAVLRQELSQSAQNAITTASIDNGYVAPNTPTLPPRPLGHATDESQLRERWERDVSGSSHMLRSAEELGERLQTYVIDLLGERVHTPDISADADLVIEQMAQSPWSDGPLTLITASEPARLEAAMQAISQPRFWQKLNGSRAVFNHAQEQIDVSSGIAETEFVVTQPTSISNWRLVLAGYYSNNPLLYTLAVLLIAPGLGIVCGQAIRRSGQGQSDRMNTTSEGAANA
ncbi:MAG: cellulose biosynthesis cyclic di-GMP-binding regulatory protein BcsB [Devosiaceae bacterium]